MKKGFIRSITLFIVCLLLTLPSMAFAADDQTPAGLTEEVISNTVKQIVKEHGPVTEPFVVNSGLIDPIDGFEVLFYIMPPTNPMARASTTLSNHTIKQGQKLIYSKSDGTPWITVTSANLHLSLYMDGLSSNTLIEIGHINTSTNSVVNSVQTTGTYYGAPANQRYWKYDAVANATSIRFFIQNFSAADIQVYGSISF